jgi:hypothetical protein
MQLIETGHGPGLSLNTDEVLTRDFLLQAFRQHGQILDTAALDWTDLLFEVLEEFDGEDLVQQ